MQISVFSRKEICTFKIHVFILKYQRNKCLFFVEKKKKKKKGEKFNLAKNILQFESPNSKNKNRILYIWNTQF